MDEERERKQVLRDRLWSRSSQMSPVETWVSRFALQCVAEVSTRTLAAEPPSYTQIMELDRKVRDFAVPPEVVAIVEDIKTPVSDEDPVSLSTSMGRLVMSHCREISEWHRASRWSMTCAEDLQSFCSFTGASLRKLSSTALQIHFVATTRRRSSRRIVPP